MSDKRFGHEAQWIKLDDVRQPDPVAVEATPEQVDRPGRSIQEEPPIGSIVARPGRGALTRGTAGWEKNGHIYPWAVISTPGHVLLRHGWGDARG